ncbi:MAG: ParB N-terminal domain-containing protein [Gammaproteobacteria bacterium]|nr:ParB N-terminal domain-containing protein [Gammaproteobacteria bacterium]
MKLHVKGTDAGGLTGSSHADLEHDDTGGEHGDLALRRIEVCRISRYERQPRSAENPAYGRLKAAIRRDGLTQPLAVTRRQGAAGYVLWGGGSTRLRILKELAAETGEPRFAVAQCLLRPWRGEAELLLSHVKENELRGPVPFVDLAVAVASLRAMLEREADAAFDERRLARRLGALGFEIDSGTIALATYVVERLSPVLPLAAQGLGRSDIESTRSLDQGARALWRDWSIDAVEEYERVFRTLTARYDGPGWALSDLRRALVEEMAVRGDRSAQTVALELQARLSRLGTDGDNR